MHGKVDLKFYFCKLKLLSDPLFNPKQHPEGMEEYVWIKQLAQLIEKIYLLGPGANDVFMESANMGTFKEMQDRVLKQKKKASNSTPKEDSKK